MLPTRLPDLKPGSLVTLDYEARGLYPDDGDRICAASVAWDPADEVRPLEPLASSLNIVHHAWAFDQGAENKPWYTGSVPMFGGDEHNLPLTEWDALHHWLLDNRVSLNAHNAQYDVTMAGAGVRADLWGGGEHGYDLLPLLRHDTMVSSHWLRSPDSAALKPTYAKVSGDRHFLEIEKGKDAWIKKNKRVYVKMGYPDSASGYDIVPWEIIGAYASGDAYQSHWLAQRDLADFETSEWYGFYLQDIEIVRQAIREERRGLPFSANRSLHVVPEVNKRARAIAKELPFTQTSDGAKEYFYGRAPDPWALDSDEPAPKTSKGADCLGLVPEATSPKTGKPELSSLVVAHLVAEEVPFADKWRDFSLLKRSDSMYYTGWAEKTGPDDRLRARLRTKGTVSSRFSIERVNLQAMPQDNKMDAKEGGVLEGLPTPRQLIHQSAAEKYPDMILCEVDASQAELRLGAYESGCATMLDKYAEGVDVHQLTAELIGCPRKPGKVANLSLEYGASPGTFKVMLENWGMMMPIREVEEIHRGWNSAYPEFRKANKKWERIAKRQGYVPFTNGVRRHFRPWEDFHSAWNQRVQGSLAQFMLRWILAAEDVCRRWGVNDIPGAGVLLQVHDSQICLLPRDSALDIMREIRQEGLDLWEDEFPGLPSDFDWAEFGVGPIDLTATSLVG